MENPSHRKDKFIPGLELAEMFFREIVQKLIAENFPQLAYSAALIGTGSEVLGYDTLMSIDHCWGPRMQIFLGDTDFEKHSRDLDGCFKSDLPSEFKSYSVNFSDPDPDDSGTQIAQKTDSGPVNHLIEICTIDSFFRKLLAINPSNEITDLEWLTIPEQKLLEATRGKVFHDGLEKLERIRETLDYYPREIWMYKMACQWKRIAQEEPFIGRCGDLDDELGSRIVASRLVRDIIRLCFLQSREYAPYSKWLGTAFSRLSCSKVLLPVLQNVLNAAYWKNRENYICQAYIFIADQHNKLKITKPIDPSAKDFHDRPFRVIDAERFTKAIRAEIKNETIRAIKSDIGGVDQFTDSTDVASYPQIFSKLKIVYE